MVYDQAEGHIGRKVAVLVGDDVCIHSCAPRLESLVHILRVRNVAEHKDWVVALVQSVKTSLKNHVCSLRKSWVLSRYV